MLGFDSKGSPSLLTYSHLDPDDIVGTICGHDKHIGFAYY